MVMWETLLISSNNRKVHTTKKCRSKEHFLSTFVLCSMLRAAGIRCCPKMPLCHLSATPSESLENFVMPAVCGEDACSRPASITLALLWTSAQLSVMLKWELRVPTFVRGKKRKPAFGTLSRDRRWSLGMNATQLVKWTSAQLSHKVVDMTVWISRAVVPVLLLHMHERCFKQVTYGNVVMKHETLFFFITLFFPP